MGYVDDTYLAAVSGSIKTNCRLLEEAHDKCIKWAKAYDAKFEPKKYHVIHFTRSRKKEGRNLIPNIPGFAGPPVKSLTVLGVEVDSVLRWRAQVEKVCWKEFRLNWKC